MYLLQMLREKLFVVLSLYLSVLLSFAVTAI